MGTVYHHTNETTLEIQCNNQIPIELTAIYEEGTIKITIEVTLSG